MKSTWISVNGVVTQGYRVASGPSVEYPYGALDRQRPFFKARGLDLESYFNGTLNIDIRPYSFEMLWPEYTFKDVAWTDLHPPETFSFSRCKVLFQGGAHRGWVYYPQPETKKRHFQNPCLLEVIADLILGIAYGERVLVQVNPEEIAIHESA